MLSEALPGLKRLREYEAGGRRRDLVAGVVLAAYLLPAGIGDRLPAVHPSDLPTSPPASAAASR
jgi:MFS superfamily sulfate permease-like transporter